MACWPVSNGFVSVMKYLTFFKLDTSPTALPSYIVCIVLVHDFSFYHKFLDKRLLLQKKYLTGVWFSINQRYKLLGRYPKIRPEVWVCEYNIFYKHYIEDNSSPVHNLSMTSQFAWANITRNREKEYLTEVDRDRGIVECSSHNKSKTFVATLVSSFSLIPCKPRTQLRRRKAIRSWSFQRQIDPNQYSTLIDSLCESPVPCFVQLSRCRQTWIVCIPTFSNHSWWNWTLPSPAPYTTWRRTFAIQATEDVVK